jgi:type I restriction enzyme S subunit
MAWRRYPSYRDSGAVWLGEVPEGWDGLKLKYVAKPRSGHTPSRNHPEYWENCTIPWSW